MRRRLFVGAALLAAVVWLAGPGLGVANAQSTYPNKTITILAPFGTGGSVDRLSRGLAQFWRKYLGVPVIVQNKPGASGLVGTQYFLQQADAADGYEVMVGDPFPYTCNNITQQHAKFKMTDFSFMNAQWADVTGVFVPKNSKYQTMADLINAIKANPGKLSAAQLSADSGMTAWAAMFDALGLPQNAVRMVTYQGGGAERTALAGAQVDASILPVDGTKPIKSLVRLLAVFEDQPLSDWPSPTIHEALKPFGVDVPNITSSVRTLMTTAKFKQDYPQRYQLLEKTYKETLQDPAFQQWLKTNDIAGTWRGPEKSTELINSNCQLLQKYEKKITN